MVPTNDNQSDFTLAKDPFALFELWFADASRGEPDDPNATALATVDDDGLPNVRMVLLKGIDDPGTSGRGFVFYTNWDGVKGRELLARPKAAMCFHWKSLQRQVRLRGPVTPVSAAEADIYFASRSRESRIGAWASQQSRPLQSREDLENAVASMTAKFSGTDVPRPAHWSGFRLTPVEIEFWHGRPARLHDRVVFKPIVGGWTRTRLYP